MGLMGRSTLADGDGLWLPDSNGIHMMFMRFPIDAIFLGNPTAEDAAVRPVVSVHPRPARVDRAGAVRPGRARRAGAPGRHDRGIGHAGRDLVRLG